MKFISIFIASLLIIGCVGPAKFTIPDEPTFRQTNAYVYEDGIFIEKRELEILVNNMRMLDAYADKLRKLLIDIQKNGR